MVNSIRELGIKREFITVLIAKIETIELRINCIRTNEFSAEQFNSLSKQISDIFKRCQFMAKNNAKAIEKNNNYFKPRDFLNTLVSKVDLIRKTVCLIIEGHEIIDTSKIYDELLLPLISSVLDDVKCILWFGTESYCSKNTKIIPINGSNFHIHRRNKGQIYCNWLMNEIDTNNGDAWRFVDDLPEISNVIIAVLTQGFDISANAGSSRAAAIRFFLDVSYYLEINNELEKY